MIVRLLPTGRAELLGLAASLGRIFPGHQFETIPRRINPDETRDPYDPFTTSTVQPSLQTHVSSKLDALVSRLAAEAHPGRSTSKDRRADLVILLEDSELANRGPEGIENISAAVRDAVQRHLAKLDKDGNIELAKRTRDALRQRASFHLAVPMLESWFFSGDDALRRAGVPADRLPARLKAGIDPEELETDDETYRTDGGEDCKALVERRARLPSSKDKAPWLIEDRVLHPKAYLSWLCHDPDDDKRCSSYRETRGGVAALETLDWSRILAAPTHYRAARAMIEDIADALDQRPVGHDERVGAEHPALSTQTPRPSRLLRNI